MNKNPKFNFLYFILAIVTIVALYSIFIEPKWIKVKEIKLSDKNHKIKLVHISDLHYKGDKAYLRSVIEKINQIDPEFVCFTGDLVEDVHYLSEALNLIIMSLRCPIFGAPGNHDYYNNSNFKAIKTAFQSTGGDWLRNESVKIPKKQIEIIGLDGFSQDFFKNKFEKREEMKKILLVHYPKIVDELKVKFDLILAGHSHGGQVKIPFWGAILLPFGVGKYEKGLFQTNAGPLYVNCGIGTYVFPVRFNCRPEITIIKCYYAKKG
jgi:predicted MPP superfamily phosphohydrolase